MMRIALLALSFLPRRGGMEYVVHDLAVALEETGNDVTVFAPRLRRGEKEIEHPYRLVRFGSRLPGAYRSGANRWSIRREFGRRHSERPFDVLNVHSAHLATDYARSAVRGRRVPIVVTCHGHDVQTDPSVGYGLRLVPRHDRRIRRNLARADRVVAISESMRQELEGMVDPERLAVVPNGVSMPPDAAAEADDPVAGEDPEVVVLMVGRNHPKKGFRDGLEAFRKVADRRGRVRLLHVGRGGEALEEEARRLGLSDRFRSVGEVDRDGIWPFYRSADIFLLPSTVESFGLVTVEAMACGLPCIVTDVPGSRDLVRDGRTGRVVPPEDEDAMANALVDLIDHPSDRRRLGGASRVLAEERYGWPSVARRYVDLFESCITPGTRAYGEQAQND